MESINLVILVCAGLALASVFTSVVAFRAGAPLLLFFLGVGLVAGRDGPGGIVIADESGAFLVASTALAIILFDSGFHTNIKSYRLAAGPAIMLATLGVVITTLMVALPARMILGLGWLESLLLATSLSSTDAAALFFLLRVGGMTIRDRVRSTLEVESGTNDPVAAFLTITLVDLLTGRQNADWLDVSFRLALQAGGGVVLGLAGGLAIVFVVNRVKLEPGLYPVVVMALAVAVYALTNLLDGSGFLAAYLAGLVAGNAGLQWAGTLRRFQDGITWLAQISMFVTLGLLARPSQFPAVALPSFGLAAVLIFLARPVAVYLCLLPFRFGTRERLFIAWVGLRGAVSILLALVPILGGIAGGRGFFEISFLVVVVSLVVQGWTVRPLARWLGLIVPQRAGLVDRLEVDLPGLADRELVTYRLHPDSPVAQGRHLPRWARPLLARRGDKVRNAPRHLQAGDQVYLLAAPRQLPLLDKLFGRSGDASAAEASLYGDFVISPDATLKALREIYDLPLIGGDQGATLSELFHREFRSDLEVGDRLHLGPVDLIVREVGEGRIHSIGISLEPASKPLAGWERWKAKLIATLGWSSTS